MKRLLLPIAVCCCALAHAQTTVTIATDPHVQPVVKQWIALAARANPQTSYRLALRPLPAVFGTLTSGTAQIVILTRAAWEVDARPFRFVFGYPATGTRVGTFNPLDGPAVYVHRHNPLRELTLHQVASIFTQGSAAGDITHWSQVLPQEDRIIHPYGPRDDGGWITNLRAGKLGGHALADRYEAFPSANRALQAVALDQFGIALVDQAQVSPGLHRLTILPDHPGDPDPLANPIMIYLNLPKGAAPDPSVEVFVQIALSPAGQRLLTGDFHPLTPNALPHIPSH